MNTKSHIPVAMVEVMNDLQIECSDRIYDGTLGSCGHSFHMAEKLHPKNGSLVCGDVDSHALVNAKMVLSPFIQSGLSVDFIQCNFEQAHKESVFVEKKPNKILLDLGWSMDQFIDSQRGFSFMIDGPLDMRLEYPSQLATASDLVNSLSESELIDIFETFGEEQHAREIAKKICALRKKNNIGTTFDLVQVIESAGVRRTGKIHPATKTFQALRIAVNHEFQALFSGIPNLISLLAPGGRLCIITFHSSEDRIVKRMFESAVHSGAGVLLHKKVVVPSRNEILTNPRSRSAKIRTLQKHI